MYYNKYSDVFEEILLFNQPTHEIKTVIFSKMVKSSYKN
jgi:hypothetical protein